MPIEWAIILVVAVSDAILLAETSFRLEASPELRILGLWILLAVIIALCRLIKSFPRITHRLAHLSCTVLSLILFSNAVSILSFILTGILPLPTWDRALATADRALGLDWLDMYQWLTRHPAIEDFAHAVYNSLGWEMLILLIALELLGHRNQARAFLLWFMVSTIAALGIGTLIPAAGAFVYYHLPVASTIGYVSQWADLRDGTLRTINPYNYQGLVVFPSFHATLAVLCACAAWPLRIVKIPLLALNLLIILSSPATGGHYFIDIIAGTILAALTISLTSYILSWTGRRLKQNVRHADVPALATK
ncbi:MAG TPA: phosphatase PAP2 family protein [Methylocella sp.]|jgi:membrane-associated phospholipid phosphatase|nr:phosphatase PAP2 family protein [Methylocella sp.]